jgi:hypothetical protein
MPLHCSAPRACRRAPIAVALACTLTAAVLAAPALTSTWLAHPVAVDGMPDEWPKLDPLEKGVTAAVSNDDQYLYLTIASNDPDARAVMATGLIVWFDPSGGKTQTFGIWMGGVAPPLLPGMAPGDSATPSSGRSSRVLTEFDLLGPNKNQRRLVDITPALDITLATGTDDMMTSYEMRVPLAAAGGRIYAVNSRPGAVVGLGIATPDRPRERRSTMVGSGGRIGGNPYYGGAGGGGFADFAEPDERIKPLNVWTTVKLATAP